MGECVQEGFGGCSDVSSRPASLALSSTEGTEQAAGWHQGRRDILMSYLHNQVALFRRLGAGGRVSGFTFVSPPAGVAHAKIGYVCGGLWSGNSSPPHNVPTSGLLGAAGVLPSGCTSCQLHCFRAHSLLLASKQAPGGASKDIPS